MSSPKAIAGELVLRCFNAATVAHILHLKTDSFSAHSALGEFYDQVVDTADQFAECYQGVYGRLTEYPNLMGFQNNKDYRNGLVVMAELRKWIVDNRYGICPEEAEKNDDEEEEEKEDTELQNLIDEIVALIDRTAYKLKFLK